MSTMEYTSKNPFRISLVAAILTILLYGILFVQVKAKNERTSVLLSDIEVQAKQEGALASAHALAQETAGQRAKLKSGILGSAGVLAFIEMLEALGRDTGVSLTIGSLEPAPPEKKEGGELRLTLRFEGEWSKTVRFLGLLELLPFEASLSDVRLFRLSDEKKERWGSTVTLSVLQKG